MANSFLKDYGIDTKIIKKIHGKGIIKINNPKSSICKTKKDAYNDLVYNNKSIITIKDVDNFFLITWYSYKKYKLIGYINGEHNVQHINKSEVRHFIDKEFIIISINKIKKYKPYNSFYSISLLNSHANFIRLKLQKIKHTCIKLVAESAADYESSRANGKYLNNGKTNASHYLSKISTINSLIEHEDDEDFLNRLNYRLELSYYKQNSLEEQRISILKLYKSIEIDKIK